MKLSPSLKVGILTLVALTIFLFTVLWVKGRSFSSAERIEVQFKDVNGMRPGSGVQMMGLRVGQVEEIIPVIENESSYVKLKFWKYFCCFCCYCCRCFRLSSACGKKQYKYQHRYRKEERQRFFHSGFFLSYYIFKYFEKIKIFSDICGGVSSKNQFSLS